MSFFGQTDFFTRVALGLISGATRVPLVVGKNTSISTSFADVSDFGDMTFPTANESLEVVSDNVNDASAGTGMRTVVLLSLDQDSNIQTAETVTLNGTTPVAVSGSHFRVRFFGGVTAGTVGGANTGTITLRVSGGGATRAQIKPGNGVAFNSFYHVPAGKTALVTQASAWVEKDDDAIARSVNRNTGQANPSVNVGAGIPVYQNSVVLPMKTATLPEKYDFWHQAKSSTSAEVTTVAEIVEFDDTVFGTSVSDYVSIP